MTSTNRVPTKRRGVSSALVAVIVVGIGSFLAGGLTSFGQTYLPEWFRSLSNSAGGWTILAFVLVWLSRARPVLGAVLGVVSFLTLNEAYGLVSNWRGFFYADPFSSVWTRVGLLAGPVIGVAAGLVRHLSPLWRVLGLTVPASVLLGEGVWALRSIADTTSPVYWWLEIAGAATMVAAGVLLRPLPAGLGVLPVAVWLAGSAGYFLLATLILS